VGLGILVASSYEAFHTNRLRYLWPFSAPWLMGLAALGDGLGELLARVKPTWQRAGLLVPVLSGLALASKQPETVADLAASASAVTAQQVSLGRWARALPLGTTLGVNDAGAIAFYSKHPTFDIVGLTTAGEALYWVAGAGSRFEHYEQLARHELPTHFIVYPHWFRIPSLLGPCLTERVVRTSNVLGGARMIACQADYTKLGSGRRPVPDITGRRLLGVLDVANLESEARKGYELGRTTADDNVVVEFDGWVDGGRRRRTREAFWLQVAPGGLVVVRLGASRPGRVTLTFDGRTAVTSPVGASAFEEVRFELPADLPPPRHGVVERSGESAVMLESNVPLTLLHYWSYAAPSRSDGVQEN
jgi:hypothetical protein